MKKIYKLSVSHCVVAGVPTPRVDTYHASAQGAAAAAMTAASGTGGAWAVDRVKPELSAVVEGRAERLSTWYYDRGTRESLGVDLVQIDVGA